MTSVCISVVSGARYRTVDDGAGGSSSEAVVGVEPGMKGRRLDCCVRRVGMALAADEDGMVVLWLCWSWRLSSRRWLRAEGLAQCRAGQRSCSDGWLWGRGNDACSCTNYGAF